MGISPPNWQWCQSCSEDERTEFFEASNKEVRVLKTHKHFAPIIKFYDDLPVKKSELALCVIPANEYAQKQLEDTKDSLLYYAKKCGADYIELSGDQCEDWPMANKYRLSQVTEVYEKTLYVDCDVLIKQDAPNIFDLTPDNKISIFNELEIHDSHEWIKEEQELVCIKLNLEKVERKAGSKMLNAGVMVIPRSVAGYYQQPENPYPRFWCFDQHLLTLTLPEDKLFELDERFNTEYIGADFKLKLDDAYFVHVNGCKDLELRSSIMLAIKNNEDLEGFLIDLLSPVSFSDKLPKKCSSLSVCTIPANQIALDQLEITRENIVNYAKRCGADYIELSGDQCPDYPMYNKYRLHQVTSVYEKTLYLDCDVVVKEDAPDIFQMTQDDKLYAYNQQKIIEENDMFGDTNHGTEMFNEKEQVREFFNLEQHKYIQPNGGVLVIPKSLCDLYKQPDRPYPKMWCFDQHFLSCNLGDNLGELEKEFNWEYIRYDFWNGLEESYFIHADGSRPLEYRLELLKRLVDKNYSFFKPPKPDDYSGHDFWRPVWYDSTS